MTWTYTGAPDTTTSAGMRDAVRLMVGDTDTSDQQVTDEVIAFWLAQQDDDVTLAAIEVCRNLEAKYARQVDVKMGNTSVAASARSAHYKELRETLETKRRTRAEFFAGGLTVTGKEDLASDTDAIQPHFESGQDDYQEADQSRWDNS